METKKIYVVASFGGEWDSKWSDIECAFTTKEAAEAYMSEQEALGINISDEQFEEIKTFLAEEEYELQNKFYDPMTGKLYDDVKLEDYREASEYFNNEKKYELLKEKFNIEKEDYDKKEYKVTNDFVGFMVKEVDLCS